MDLKISLVLFDSWFCVKGFIKQLERRKLTFIGDMKSSNALEYRLPDQRTTVLLALAKILKYGRSLFKKVCLGLKSSEDHPPDKVLYETYTKVGYVAAFGGRYQIVHSIDRRTKASKIVRPQKLMASKFFLQMIGGLFKMDWYDVRKDPRK